jgi:peptide methionine sulfoxide reductase msrA/msrB
MRKLVAAIALLAMPLVFGLVWAGEETGMSTKEYRELTPEEEAVIVDKGTEFPFSGEYYDHFEKGTYHCRRCDAPLYRSSHKFATSCGWPSFDDEIEGAVRHETDADGMRTEILCADCGAHLGHVFEGEMLTDKNVRHCVNSISLVFVPDEETVDTARAYFAGGCFWGVEHLFEGQEGVISAASGYMGGSTENPTYEEVISGITGHMETVEVEYDPEKVTYEELARYFFEIHDPTQAGGQGPDIGEQYLSAVFYRNDEEKETAERLIGILRDKGYDVVTKVLPAGQFWEAEGYHQDYYARTGRQSYCHVYTKRF